MIVHFNPADNTTPYTAEVDGDMMTVRYVNTYDGESETVLRIYTKQGGQWRRGSWRRVLSPHVPATTPPSGAYVVQEQTDEPPAWTTRETGTYHE